MHDLQKWQHCKDKGGQCAELTTLPPSIADCLLKSRSLNFLEPSGPVQACDGIALPFNSALTCVSCSCLLGKSSVQKVIFLKGHKP